MEFREGDSLEGSAHTPMYKTYILSLSVFFSLFLVHFRIKSKNCEVFLGNPKTYLKNNLVISGSINQNKT